MKLSFKKREAIIRTVDKWEKLADCQESQLWDYCALCPAFGGDEDWRFTDCEKCPVFGVFGRCPDTENDDPRDAPCIGLIQDPSLAATAAAMLAAVLGVKVPKQK